MFQLDSLMFFLLSHLLFLVNDTTNSGFGSILVAKVYFICKMRRWFSLFRFSGQNHVMFLSCSVLSAIVISTMCLFLR